MDNLERIRVGFRAAGFSLADSVGEPYNLSDVLKRKMVILVFVPGAEWQYLRPFLKKWEEVSHQIEKQTSALLIISSERSIRTHHLKKELDLRFPILWDESSKTAELYGVLSQNSMVTYPAIFLVDEEGIIRYKEVFVDLERIPVLDRFLLCLKG